MIQGRGLLLSSVALPFPRQVILSTEKGKRMWKGLTSFLNILSQKQYTALLIFYWWKLISWLHLTAKDDATCALTVPRKKRKWILVNSLESLPQWAFRSLNIHSFHIYKNTPRVFSITASGSKSRIPAWWSVLSVRSRCRPLQSDIPMNQEVSYLPSPLPPNTEIKYTMIKPGQEKCHKKCNSGKAWVGSIWHSLVPCNSEFMLGRYLSGKEVLWWDTGSPFWEEPPCPLFFFWEFLLVSSASVTTSKTAHWRVLYSVGVTRYW